MIDLEDWAAVNDVLSRYVWAIDAADGEAWAALWTEDGVLGGADREPVRGRAALAGVARGIARYHGGMRHLYSNLLCEYLGAGRDRVEARFYSHVTLHKAFSGKGYGMALCRAELVREGGRWLIASNDLDVRGPKGAA
jgi:hypothetical protein